jgi:hypothetical protein
MRGPLQWTVVIAIASCALASTVASAQQQPAPHGTNRYYSACVPRGTQLQRGDFLVPDDPRFQRMAVVGVGSPISDPGRICGADDEILALCIDLHLSTPTPATHFTIQPLGAPEDVQRWLAKSSDVLSRAWIAYQLQSKWPTADPNRALWSARIAVFEADYRRRASPPGAAPLPLLALGPGSASRDTSPASTRRLRGPQRALDIPVSSSTGRPEELTPQQLEVVLGGGPLLLAADADSLAISVGAARQRRVFVAEERRATAAAGNLTWLRGAHVDASRTRLWVHDSMASRAQVIGGVLGLSPVVGADGPRALQAADAVVFVYASGAVDLARLVATPELAGKVVVLLACQDEDGSLSNAAAARLVEGSNLRALVVMHDSLDESRLGDAARALRDALRPAPPADSTLVPLITSSIRVTRAA